MKKAFTLQLIALLFTSAVFGQMKPEVEQRAQQSTNQTYSVEELAEGIQIPPAAAPIPPERQVTNFAPQTISTLVRPQSGVLSHWYVKQDPRNGRPYWISGELADADDLSPEEQCREWLEQLAETLGIEAASESFILGTPQTDELGMQHLRMRQHWQGVPIHGAEMVAHFRDGKLVLVNGESYPTPELSTSYPTLTADAAIARAKEIVGRDTHVKELSDWERDLILGEPAAASLVIFHADRNPTAEALAWRVTIVPHLAQRRQVMLDAHTGELLRDFDHICHVLPPDGPEVTNATDLLGQSREIHSYEFSGNNYLIDASRDMFNAQFSDIPDDGVGVIWTIDGNGTSPINDNFTTTHVTSGGNFWNDPLAVSAHYNAGEVYRYFEETFNRNSINGNGGNVISLINISDENGEDMDNAFWNGVAMFYGNGDFAFTAPLAKALDVAGHEVSHGVVQNTANLEYFGESGAMNESFADVFGAMIDRDDWRMGEDVVNTNIYSTGALRDLANPNNGGNSLNDPGYQPAHTNEQYTGSEDNGGVHINSGIPNRAFFLFASNVGKAKAEQVYYRALTTYLTRSSQFLSLREAVIQSAQDLYGSAEAGAAADAFTAVGIGSGGGGTPPPDPFADLETNPGNEYILFSDGQRTELLIETPEGTSIADPLTTLSPLSKPTITDDGSLIVYVAQDQTIRAIVIDWGSGQSQSVTISSQQVWRNAAISRDGLRLAALTDSYLNEIEVFDLSQEPVQGIGFELFNPTFSEGVSTGDVQYADVLEWDHSGEFILYDALNVIPTNNIEDISYWDIGFVKAWDNGSNDFGNGFISKLISQLPENTSVGNPTFSKNSPYIIAFDFIDNNDNTYFLLAGNTETGEIGTLFQNADLSYPNYSNQDDEVIFDGFTQGDRVIGTIDVDNTKINPVGEAVVFISNGFDEARWGVWFANGIRQLVDVDNLPIEEGWIRAYPTIVEEQLTVEWQADQAADLALQLYDQQGRVLWQSSQWMLAGEQRVSFRLPNLPAGVYVLCFSDGHRLWRQQIIRQ